MNGRRFGSRRFPGFTLIEMLLVVGILVILAGLLLPKLDGVSLKTNKGVAANNMASLSRYIQTYRVLHNLYPDRWDSLLNPAGTGLQAAGTTSLGIDPQLTGLPAPAVHTKLKISTAGLTDGEITSLSRIGIKTMLDWGGSGVEVPSNGFTAPRSIATGAKYATINTADGDGAAVIDYLYPELNAFAATPTSGQIPTGTNLMVVGFGPTNQAIGDVMETAPKYSNTDPTHYYANFLAIFEIRDNGHRALLKAVVGADGDLLPDEINEYYEAP